MLIISRLIFFSILQCSCAYIWLPFANLGTMFETLKQTALTGKVDFNEPDTYSIIEMGKDFFNNIGNFFSSSFGDQEKLSLATNLREIFNLTTTTNIPKTTKRFLPKIIPVDKPIDTTPMPEKETTNPFISPYTSRFVVPTSTEYPEITSTYDPRPFFKFSTTTEATIIKFVRTTKAPLLTTEQLEIPSVTDNQKQAVETKKYATFSPLFFTTTRPSSNNIHVEPESSTINNKLTTTSTKVEPSTSQILRIFTKPTVYPIWPTTTRSIENPSDSTTFQPTQPSPSIIRPANIWKKITPSIIPEHTTSILWTTAPTTIESAEQTATPSFMSTSTADIPHIIKAKKFTRPPINEKIAVTLPTVSNKYDTCLKDQKCSIKLKSFETMDPLFQYCYSHSTMIEDSIQELLKDTQTAVLPVHISWRQSVTPEVVQLMQTLMTLYRPSRCLVIGVFTGLGLLGIAERVDSRGIIVALEHPAYAIFWEKVGRNHAKKLTTAQLSRIQIRTSESIEKSLPRLATNEPNTFDFIFIDDFKRENYLDDYEHSVRLLRSGGLLVINQALNNGGVMSPIEFMTNDDRVIRNMNIRIKQDARVSASLLPYGGGTWIISKN